MIIPKGDAATAASPCFNIKFAFSLIIIYNKIITLKEECLWVIQDWTGRENGFTMSA